MTGPATRIERDVEMPMRDGVVLRGDVWRPDDDEPHPVILRRMPYNKATMAPNSDYFRITDFVANGYVCIQQDTRGRFASEGDWAAVMWEQEGLDTYDTVEWVAAQPWCDGNVGMSGGSYLGYVQWMGAVLHPPHLKAIAPAISTSEEWYRRQNGGAFSLNSSLSWLAFMSLDWLMKEAMAGRLDDPMLLPQMMAVATDPTPAMEHLPLGKVPVFDIPGFPIRLEDLVSGRETQGATFAYEDVAIPTLSIGGWFDLFSTGQVEGFLRMREAGGGDDEVRSSHRLIMGPWVHATTLPSEQGDVNFGIMAEGVSAQLSEKHMAFFDRHLKGAGADLPPVEYFLMGADEWRTADQWPPAGAATRQWFLGSDGHANSAHGDGVLTPDEPTAGAELDMFDYDPMHPMPTRGGRVCLGRVLSGPRDQSLLEGRDDMLCYTSAVLDEALDVVGPVKAHLVVRSSARDTDFAAKLVDVHPDGSSILVADGILRARYRQGFDREVLLVPGEPVELTVDLGHTAWRFKPGHRLRLDVAGSDFPHWDRNLNTGNTPGEDAEGPVARQEVLHSTAHRSRLELTVL